MLKFGKGLKIKFWNVRNQITEGVIQFKTSLEQNAYIVDVVSSGSCIVHRDQISCVLLKDFLDNDVWVPIDNLYKSFSNDATITPDTRYDPTSIVFEPASLKVRLSPIRSNSLNYVKLDEQVEDAFKQFLKEVKTMNFLSFEVEHNSIWDPDTMICRLKFEIDVKEAYKYEPLMKRSRDSLQIRQFGEYVLSAFLDATNLPKPKKIIFHDPATIVFWEDGTKTVVKKTENDTDDREKAVMFAILKKVCGSRGNMNRYLKSFKEDKSNEEKKEEAGSSELCQCEQGAGEGSIESTV